MPVCNPMDVTGRRFLVTGASGGIGREVAKLLSELGGEVIACGRDTGRLNQTLASLSGKGHRAEIFDLEAVDQIPAWLKRLATEAGPLDGVVHSAGVHQLLPVRFVNAAKIDAVMRTNVSAALMLARGLSQKGCHAARSSLVLLSSVVATAGQPGISVYAASKASLIGLCRSLAMELAKEGVRVNCVAPGTIETDMAEHLRELLTPEQFLEIQRMHPLGLGTASDVAQAVAYLCSDAGRWVTGTTLTVDGGYSAH